MIGLMILEDQSFWPSGTRVEPGGFMQEGHDGDWVLVRRDWLLKVFADIRGMR